MSGTFTADGRFDHSRPRASIKENVESLQWCPHVQGTKIDLILIIEHGVIDIRYVLSKPCRYCIALFVMYLLDILINQQKRVDEISCFVDGMLGMTAFESNSLIHNVVSGNCIYDQIYR